MNMSGIIGQEKAKNLLRRAKQSEMNILLVAPPGYGKTMMARRYLERDTGPFGESVIELNGTQKMKDILESIKRYSNGSFLIDEAHKMRGSEAIYKYIDGEVSSGFFSRSSHRLFALATTDEGSMPPALNSRLIKIALRPYTIDDLSKIASLVYRYPRDVLEELAVMSRGSPRRVKMLADLLTPYGIRTVRATRDRLASLGFPHGLDTREVEMLKMLAGGPVGMSTLAGLMNTNTKTVRRVESDLIASRLVKITSKGRSLTEKGIETLISILEEA